MTALDDLFSRRRLVLVAGPCVVESYELCRDVAQHVRTLAQTHGVGYIFKASFDKANRTSGSSYRGLGPAAGLEVLAQVRRDVGVPVLTDIHTVEQAHAAAAAVDVLQIPAFLCRQTDLLHAAAATGKATNIKKGQFLAPADMRHVAHKFRSVAGAGPLAITERGSCFGYHDLVVDMRGLLQMAAIAPVIFDATHSVQRPGGGDGVTTGDRRLAPPLARAAVAVGVDGLFCEVHPNPDEALSDGPNSLTLPMLDELLRDAVAIRQGLARARGL